jgi:hypothetical protein
VDAHACDLELIAFTGRGFELIVRSEALANIVSKDTGVRV